MGPSILQSPTESPSMVVGFYSNTPNECIVVWHLSLCSCGWLQRSWASVNRSESQIIAAATADFRARGINIKLDALSRSSDVVKVRICFGLALWLASCQWDVDPSLLAVPWSRLGTLYPRG